MKFCGFFILTAAAVLIICAQQSSGFDVSLCLGDLAGSQCKIGKSLRTWSKTSALGNTNKNSEARLAAKNAYNTYNNTVAACEEKIKNTLDNSKTLVANNQTDAAIRLLEQGLDQASSIFYNAGSAFFKSLGKASILSNGTASEGIAAATEGLNLVALEVIDVMTTIKSIANQTMSTNKQSAMEAIQTGSQIFQSVFTALHSTAESSSQQTDAALSTASGVKPEQKKNSAAESNDSDISAAISKINKAADKAIQRGANPNIVNPLRQGLISLLMQVGEVASDVKKYYTTFTKIAETSPTAAKGIYLKKSQGVCSKMEKIFGKALLALGVAAAQSNEKSSQEMLKAIEIFESANNALTIGNKYAKHWTLFGLSFDGKVRTSAFEAALQSADYGKLAVVSKTVDAGEKACNALSGIF